MTEIIVPGTFTVLPWSNSAIVVGSIPLNNVYDLECVNNINYGAGRATVNMADPDKSQYNTLLENSEIEIFLKNPDVDIANKVWGGFLETKKFDENKKNVLVITAKEYLTRLQVQSLGVPLFFVATDMRDAILQILTRQGDFTYDQISSMPPIGKLIYASYTSDANIFDCIRNICEQNDYFFSVDLTKDCFLQAKTAVVLSADSIVAQDNVMNGVSVEKNVEFQITDATVKSSATVSGTASGGSGLAKSKTIVIAGLTDNAAASNYAASLIQQYGNPLETNKISCKLLPLTRPTMQIMVNIPKKDLVGNYLVVEIKHTWSVNSGIRSTVQLSNKILDTTMELGYLTRRVSSLELGTL